MRSGLKFQDVGRTACGVRTSPLRGAADLTSFAMVALRAIPPGRQDRRLRGAKSTVAESISTIQTSLCWRGESKPVLRRGCTV
jgi:hypothetical protein